MQLIVNASSVPEDAELADTIDKLKHLDALTVSVDGSQEPPRNSAPP
jgi:hypothetical protein